MSGTAILLYQPVYLCYWHKTKSSVKASGNCICKQWPLTVTILEKMDGNYVNYEPARMQMSKCAHSKLRKASKGLGMDLLVGAPLERKI